MDDSRNIWHQLAKNYVTDKKPCKTRDKIRGPWIEITKIPIRSDTLDVERLYFLRKI